MKAYIVELPLRTIHLSLEDKEQTSLEASGLAAYLDLHQELWEVKQMAEQYRKSIKEGQLLADDLQAAYTAMEAEAQKYGSFAGFNEEEHPLFPENVDSVTLKLGDLQKRIDTFSGLVARYDEERFNPEKVYARAEEMRKHFDESFTYFNDHYFTPIINAYSVVQVDTCSLDRDFDQFREVCTEVGELYDHLIDEWNALCEKLKLIDQNVRRLNKHIKYLSDSISATGFTNGNAELN